MRLYNWEARFSDYITAIAKTPFSWGTQDCALFAAGAVEAVTGVDPAAEWRGTYSSPAEGLRAIRKAGYDNHVAAARAMFPAIHMAGILPCDLAVFDGDETGHSLGVVQGELAYVLTPAGIGLVPVSTAIGFLGVR